jgi:hypothetical protein
MSYCLLSSRGNYGILKRMIASLYVKKKHILFLSTTDSHSHETKQPQCRRISTTLSKTESLL